MRTILTICFSLVTLAFASVSSALTPGHIWSRSIGSNGSDTAFDVATDPWGNTIVVGRCYNAIDFGGGTLPTSGPWDLFIAKYYPDGSYQWALRFGSPGTDSANSVAVDNTGMIVVAGAIGGSVDFGGGPMSAGMFIVKFDPNGYFAWGIGFPGAGVARVSTDFNDNVFAIGTFGGTINLGGSNLVSAGGSDIYLARFDPNGVHTWSKRFGGTSTDSGLAAVPDGAGSVAITGGFNGNVNFGGGTLTSAGVNDIYLAKYDSTATHQWSKRFGSIGNEVCRGLAVDGAGNIAITGTFGPNPANFGGGNLTSADLEDVFVGKYDAAGNHLWSKAFGGASSDIGRDVAFDASGSLLVTGVFPSDIGFGATTLFSSGGNDVFLAKLNSAGAEQWSQHYGGGGNDTGFAVAADYLGRTVIAGDTRGGQFGGETFVNAGEEDIFVAEFCEGISEPIITSIQDIGNDQGRKVKIRFAASCVDRTTPSAPIMSYEAYRRDDAPPSQVFRLATANLSSRELLDAGWTFAGSVPAHQTGSYGIDAPTIGDSTEALGQYYSVFFIRASTADPGVFFDSPPDSGYSRDNLAPGVPGNISYTAGLLTWDESTAKDFRYFSVYGSQSNMIHGENATLVAPGALIGHTTEPTMDVSTAAYTYYFITASDFSGNEGKPAVINTLSGVGGTPRNIVLSLSAYPNPFNPRTVVKYSLPRKQSVTVDVFDARGSHVKTLVSGERPAGVHSADWDGRNDRGEGVASGVYFVRLRSESGIRNYKLTLLK